MSFPTPYLLKVKWFKTTQEEDARTSGPLCPLRVQRRAPPGSLDRLRWLRSWWVSFDQVRVGELTVLFFFKKHARTHAHVSSCWLAFLAGAPSWRRCCSGDLPARQLSIEPLRSSTKVTTADSCRCGGADTGVITGREVAAAPAWKRRAQSCTLTGSSAMK